MLPRPPPFLRTLRALGRLNVAAVGLSLGAFFSVALAPEGVFAGASTLLVGCVWAVLMRSRKTMGRSNTPIGWVLSIPLAAANAALACAAMAWHGEPHFTSVLSSALLGASFGAFVWIPALFLTLVAFGLPLRRARRLASQGLAGEERGEFIVGTTCTLVALCALTLTWALRGVFQFAIPACILARVLGVLGATTGFFAASLAHVRGLRRSDFVRRVAAGEVEGFRIQPTSYGQALVRLASQGEGYRVADFEEPLAELDARREVTRSLA